MQSKNDPFERWTLNHVINVSGTMTSLGASKVEPDIVDIVAKMLPQFVQMDELQARASRVIASATGAQSGCVTACTAAAICLSSAAAITGTNLAAIEYLPDCRDKERRIAVQSGHLVNYGAPIGQAVALSGARVVPLGSAAMCELFHLRHALREGVAAALYVVSHHTVREGELPMDLFIETCHAAGVPVIVDMASEYDLKGPIALGADLVIYSGHKFLSGVTSGIVAGREEFVKAVYLQHRGIGRTMKVGKEGVAGAMAALELWQTRDHALQKRKENARVERWRSELSAIDGLQMSEHEDWTGNPITRLKVDVHPERARCYAWELAGALASRSPAVIVRDDLIEHGYFFLDPCNVDDDEAALVAAAIKEESRMFAGGDLGLKKSWSDAKRERATNPLSVRCCFLKSVSAHQRHFVPLLF